MTIWFYFLTFAWIILISSNYYFHGCILARIERELLQDENWVGPINITLYPLHLYYKPNKQILNDYIKNVDLKSHNYVYQTTGPDFVTDLYIK